MRRCPHIQSLRGCIRTVSFTPPLQKQRLFSSHAHERVEVRCGSAGAVTIDLHNIQNHSPNSTFFIHLPPFPSIHSLPVPLPSFLQDKPVASINYRWTSPDDAGSAAYDSNAVTSRWPRPIHDTLFAYAWLAGNLAPEGQQRRDIYVYGSHLGGSLATALSLTEAHPHMRFAVRGLISYNGIYNWTMFLPDHPVNRPSKRVKNPSSRPKLVEGSHLDRINDTLRAFFRSPVDMFDPFASPSLFFHNPGLLVPESYTLSGEEAAALEAMIDMEAAAAKEPIAVPRKSHLVFPPRTSTLKIPEALFLFDSPAVAQPQRGRRRVTTGRGNTMENQALELVELMRRSIEKVELKERTKWDEDVELWEEEGLRRVQAFEVGDESSSLELNAVGQEAVDTWLAEKNVKW